MSEKFKAVEFGGVAYVYRDTVATAIDDPLDEFDLLCAEVARLQALTDEFMESHRSIEEILEIGTGYHGAEKHSKDWHDGFDTACKLWIKKDENNG